MENVFSFDAMNVSHESVERGGEFLECWGSMARWEMFSEEYLKKLREKLKIFKLNFVSFKMNVFDENFKFFVQ